ncbi:unnamed protein product [Schistosoma rodhaini]|nr:unnamed protein product [Schistosoma rodhaini]
MTMLQQKGDRNWDDNIQKKIEYDTPNSKTQANQFDKINKNFNSSLGELKSKVEGLEINRINYLRYKNPMERVTAVLKAMEEEVDHEYGKYS